MGWFDSFFGAKTNANADPLQKLDPKLREFLEKESPLKYTTAAVQQQQEKQQPGQTSGTQPTVDGANQEATAGTAGPTTTRTDQRWENGVPRESLYPDGRYAHLWKTYKPMSDVEAETKTDHEKLMDVLDAYKDRKAHIGRAALENCALEQMDWNVCMKSGDVASRMTMCSAEVKKFERCYMVQSRLLKALGYISVRERPASVDEEIQMHADTLYHQMLEREAALEKAKKEGRPAPKFAPLVPTPTPSSIVATAQGEEKLTPEMEKAIQEKLAKVPEEDRAAEEAAIKADMRARAEIAAKVQGLWKEQEREKEARKQKGTETLIDKVSGLFQVANKKDE